jgi:hypothetical protein
MPLFRLLYLDDSILEESEEVEARDVVEALHKASGKPPRLRVEVWSEKGRVAEIAAWRNHRAIQLERKHRRPFPHPKDVR